MAAQTANLFVGLGDETLNPVCDLAKRIEVAFRERLRFVYVVEILEKIAPNCLLAASTILVAVAGSAMLPSTNSSFSDALNRLSL